LRYVEIDGQLRKIMVLVKMRGAAHSTDIRAYDITPEGVIIGDRMSEYANLITGIPIKKDLFSDSKSSGTQKSPILVSHDDGAKH
jgi:KaiC/GvpD/RAD55 family RecA-like ATPase